MIEELLSWLDQQRREAENTSNVEPVTARIRQLGREVTFFAAAEFLRQRREDYGKDEAELVALFLDHQRAAVYMGGESFNAGYEDAMKRIRAWAREHAIHIKEH